VARLDVRPVACLVDGNRDPGAGLPTECLVGGDGRCASIAAAGILAKVTRDRIMAALARRYPAFGWDENAGYSVPRHREALSLVGVTPHHRKSFAPVREIRLQYALSID
ncbi:MAG: ribonuclease HII, partial [Alphaproteobacteria bacterium]